MVFLMEVFNINLNHKVIRDSNPDFRINSNSDPDDYRIASHIAKCRKNRLLTV